MILGETNNEEAEKIMMELDFNKDQLVSKQEFVEKLLRYDTRR